MIGGPRKGAVKRWNGQANSLLTVIKHKSNLENEQAFFSQLIARLEKEASVNVPGVDQIHLALSKAKAALTAASDGAYRVLATLKQRQGYILLGGGNWIVTNRDDGTVGCCTQEELYLGYEEFAKQNAIHHAQSYLDFDRQEAGHLSGLFLKACEEHLNLHYKLSSVSVEVALESLAAYAEDPEAFKHKQFAVCSSWPVRCGATTAAASPPTEDSIFKTS